MTQATNQPETRSGRARVCAVSDIGKSCSRCRQASDLPNKVGFATHSCAVVAHRRRHFSLIFYPQGRQVLYHHTTAYDCAPPFLTHASVSCYRPRAIFSAADLDGRVLYIDLDTVVTGSLEDIAGYSGPFATLSAQGMANERRPSGLNSSVMSWEAGSKTAPGVAYDLLREAYGVVSSRRLPRVHFTVLATDQAHDI